MIFGLSSAIARMVSVGSWSADPIGGPVPDPAPRRRCNLRSPHAQITHPPSASLERDAKSTSQRAWLRLRVKIGARKRPILPGIRHEKWKAESLAQNLHSEVY